MIKQKFLSLLVALFCATSIFAYDAEIDGIYYTLNSGTRTAQVVGTNKSGNLIIPSSFAYASSSYRVTSVGNKAFYGKNSLTSVSMPSIEFIGNYAFYNCIGLTSINIPSSVKSIGDYAFSGCIGLASLTIPKSVTSIGRNAFEKVLNISYNGSATGSPWGAKYINKYVEGCLIYNDNTKTTLLRCLPSATGDLTIPSSVTTISSGAFRDCLNITSVSIPNSVTEIGQYVFEGCDNLSSPLYNDKIFIYMPKSYTGVYVVPNGIQQIIANAFENCSGLTAITIPNSVTTIGYHAFYGCTLLPIVDNLRYADTYLIEAVDTTLSTYSIKDRTKWIGDDAFSGCTRLTSIFIPSSITSIGDYPFADCSDGLSVYYDGTLDEWYNSNLNELSRIPCGGAWCIQPYCFNYDLYLKNQKVSTLIIPNTYSTIKDYAFMGCNFDSISFPNALQKIGRYAFYNCNIKKIHIPVNVTQISDGAFFSPYIDTAYMANLFTTYTTMGGYDYLSFYSKTSIIITSNCSVEKNQSKICGASVNMDISPSLFEYYDEIGLSDSKSSTGKHYTADENGLINITKLSINYSKTYYIYAKKGTEYVYKDEITISTKTPSLSCSSTATQTTVTLSNISASKDESVNTLTKGIYYNGKRYEVDENNTVVLTGIAPNHKCTLQVYGCYNGEYYYGTDKYITTQSINPTITTSQATPTTVYACGSYTHGDATILSTDLNCNFAASVPQGDEGMFTGLKPNTSYTFYYFVETKEGGTYSASEKVTTPALTLTTLTPKVVSAGNVVVAASTNISDMETNVGFEWRKYNAPPELPSSRAQAILYNGQMEGILHNLSLEYWRVRAYYEAADGTCYYGEWATFDPSQPAFFEPTVHTYALVTDPTANKVQMRGYVMTGTDDVTEQGFEYWFKGVKAPRRVAFATPDSVYRVQASGQVMTAVLEDLAYSTTYTCRAYAVAGGKTYYGEEVQFLTPEDPRPIYTLSVTAGENGSVNTDVSGQYREGETVTLTATAEQGFRFVQWSDGNTDNPRQLTITANTELMAFFELADGLEWLTVDNAQCTVKKMIIDNQLFIFRGDKIYNAAGVEL